MNLDERLKILFDSLGYNYNMEFIGNNDAFCLMVSGAKPQEDIEKLRDTVASQEKIISELKQRLERMETT